MACADLPALPLQVLLWRHPEWAKQPAAVVDRDKPQGLLLWINERARQSGILPGMRYAAALALDPELRASIVPESEIAAAVDGLTQRLWSFTPRVEPSEAEPGVFWLDATGLQRLYASPRDWAVRIKIDLASAGYAASIAVGFTRFGSYAAARTAPAVARDGIRVFRSPDEEAAASREVPIARLGFDAKLRDALHRLGIERLGQFLDLPVEGLRRRFGKVAYDLYCQARGDDAAALDPVLPTEPLEARVILDHPESQLDRIATQLSAMLAPLLQTLAGRHQGLSHLAVALRLDDGSTADESLEPAEPTQDRAQIESLLRLRLGRVQLGSGVTELALAVRGVSTKRQQLDLFATRSRDLAAARRALARIRAEHGDDAVRRAYLHEGQLPEHCFSWERFERLEPPRARDLAGTSSGGRPLVRRFFPSPIALPSRARHEPDGWLFDVADGPIEETLGPFVVHAGWWLREVVRHYYYVRTSSGRWLWIFLDRQQRRWFLQGEVE